jgi:hypothetical protein
MPFDCGGDLSPAPAKARFIDFDCFPAQKGDTISQFHQRMFGSFSGKVILAFFLE